jgi:hypothetical protein
MKTKNNTHTKLTLAALAGLALAAGSVHAATPITILNGDFEDDFGGDWTEVPVWTDDNNSWVVTGANAYKPAGGSQELYLNAGGDANQDLTHAWSSSDTYTLSLSAHEAGWQVGSAGDAFSVQLREAVSGDLLWDSGDQNVDGTLVNTPPYEFTGTGHLFEWTIDASAFTEGTEGQLLNIQLQSPNSGGSVYIDNVSLNLVPEPSTTALLGLGGLALILRRRK